MMTYSFLSLASEPGSTPATLGASAVSRRKGALAWRGRSFGRRNREGWGRPAGTRAADRGLRRDRLRWRDRRRRFWDRLKWTRRRDWRRWGRVDWRWWRCRWRRRLAGFSTARRLRRR